MHGIVGWMLEPSRVVTHVANMRAPDQGLWLPRGGQKPLIANGQV